MIYVATKCDVNRGMLVVDQQEKYTIGK